MHELPFEYLLFNSKRNVELRSYTNNTTR